MDSMKIESRYFILSGKSTHGQEIVNNHGKYWKVVEEKLRIPKTNRSGFIVQAADGHVIIVRKAYSEHFKIDKEYFVEEELKLIYDDGNVETNN